MKFVMQQNNERMLKVSLFNHLILVFQRLKKVRVQKHGMV